MAFRHMSSMTPQEIAEERTNDLIRAAEIAQTQEQMIKRRLCEIRALNSIPFVLNAWEREFVGSLLHRTTRFDMDGRLGGDLLKLSPRQAGCLDLLVARHVDRETIAGLMQGLTAENGRSSPHGLN